MDRDRSTTPDASRDPDPGSTLEVSAQIRNLELDLHGILHDLHDDLSRGRLKALSVYQARAPGFESALARLHAEAEARLRAAGGEATPATAQDGEGPDAVGEIPRTLGPYRLVETLGEGGQGKVYRALDTRLGRHVALKVLSEKSWLSVEGQKRFHEEAQITARLDHPAICAVYETGTHEGRPFLAMRWIDGESLAQQWRRARSTDARPQRDGAVPRTREEIDAMVDLFLRVAEALSLAHGARVMHRDVKPGNILVDRDGQPVLVDFGLARREERDGERMTRTGDVLGTLPYMSPEQLVPGRGPIDARTDIFSLGVTMYEGFAGQRPFSHVSDAGLADAILHGEPRDPRTWNRSLPRDLVAVIRTCMEKSADRRYRTAELLVADLRRVRRHEPTHARPLPPWTRAARWAVRRPVIAALSLTSFGALVGTILLLLAWVRERDDRLADQIHSQDRLQEHLDALLVDKLLLDAEDLWPRRRSTIPRMQSWSEDATTLLARCDGHHRALAALRQRAVGQEDAKIGEFVRRAANPEHFANWDQTRAEIEVREHYVLANQIQLTADRARLAETSDEAKDVVTARIQRLEAENLGHVEYLAVLRGRRAELEADPRFLEPAALVFPDPSDQARFTSLLRLRLRRRPLEIALERVRERLRESQEFDDTATAELVIRAWDRCRSDVAQAASRYNGLKLATQPGLVPLGIDLDSGLWEFWHQESGQRPRWEGDPSWPVSEVSDPHGRVAHPGAENEGIVLILLPGGVFRMGADAVGEGPHPDPLANLEESPSHDVAVRPFLMGKYEVTQGQWLSVMDVNPSQMRNGSGNGIDGTVTLRHPVEQVSFPRAGLAAQRWGLNLPTEAQWEYAARAGTRSPWWCGEDASSLASARAGNVRDLTFQRVARPGEPCESDVDDGAGFHGPVDTWSPNPFGLHSVIGNVREWSADGYAGYRWLEGSAPKDGDQPVPPGRRCILRGGSFLMLARSCRSSARSHQPPSFDSNDVGFRVAIALELSP